MLDLINAVSALPIILIGSPVASLFGVVSVKPCLNKTVGVTEIVSPVFVINSCLLIDCPLITIFP